MKIFICFHVTIYLIFIDFVYISTYFLVITSVGIKAIIKNSLYNNDLFTKSVRDISFTYKVNSLFVSDNNIQLIKLAFMNNFLTRHSII